MAKRRNEEQERIVCIGWRSGQQAGLAIQRAAKHTNGAHKQAHRGTTHTTIRRTAQLTRMSSSARTQEQAAGLHTTDHPIQTRAHKRTQRTTLSRRRFCRSIWNASPSLRFTHNQYKHESTQTAIASKKNAKARRADCKAKNPEQSGTHRPEHAEDSAPRTAKRIHTAAQWKLTRKPT